MRRTAIFILIFLCFIVLVSAQTLNVQEGKLVKLKLSATDADGDLLSYTFTEPLDENGEWQTEEGDAGEYPVTITVSDGKTETKKEITIIVEAEEEVIEEIEELIEEIPEIEQFEEVIEELNNAPAIEDIKDIEVEEGELVKIKPIASDKDKDQITFSYTHPLDKEGEWQTEEGDAGNYKITVIASDGNAIAIKTFFINVKALEKRIQFEKLEDIKINENEVVEVELKADNAVFSIENMPKGASLEGNKFSWQPDYDFVNKNILVKALNKLYIKYIPKKTATITFIAHVDDVKEKQNLKITVVDVNREPILDKIEDIVIDENSRLELNPTYSDPDDDWLSIKYSGWTKKPIKFLNYGDAGNYKLNIELSDGIDEIRQEVNIKVNKINRAPSLFSLNLNKVSEGEEVKVILEATDPDEDDLSFYIIDAPEGAEIKDNIFTWTPNHDFIKKGEKTDVVSKIKYFDKRFNDAHKEVSVTVGVKDPANNTNEKSFNVVIYNLNRIPELSSYEPEDRVIVARKGKLIFSVDVNDPDEDELTYTWNFGLFDNLEAGSTISRVFKRKGIKEIKVKISDGKEEIEKVWKVKVI